MTVTDKILKHLQSMPEPVQVEVLHFVEYLESKLKKSKLDEETDWSTFSLSQAMQGMEEEQAPYSPKDIKDSLS